jgi:hypothetical protein
MRPALPTIVGLAAILVLVSAPFGGRGPGGHWVAAHDASAVSTALPAPSSGAAAFRLATSEGVQTINAAEWHAAGFTGAGVKVAVIDGSFKDIGAVANTFNDFAAGGCDNTSGHGTAVAQIVRDVAPAAEIHAFCVKELNDLWRAKGWATGAGVRVIVESLSWFNGSRGDGQGAPASPEGHAVDATAQGVLWVNSVGNFAQRHWTGTFSDPDGDGWHNFTPTDEGNSFRLPAGAGVCAYLKWDDWPVSAQDYNFSLWRLLQLPFTTDEQLEVGAPSNPPGHLFGSQNRQRGGAPPTENFCYANNTDSDMDVFLAIQRVEATASPRFDLFINRFALQYAVPAGSIAEPATSPVVLAVGAACWNGSQVEGYSSRGPTISGLTKPDLVGPDSVSSPVAEFGPFTGCGTSGFRGSSAAAPYVAGAAALVLQRFPAMSPADVKNYLEDRARDLGPPGKDNDSGAGMVHLPSLTPPPPPPPPPPAPTPRLHIRDVRLSPKPLRAGSRLRVQALITNNDAVVDTGRVLCSATVGRSRLSARQARFRNDFAECTWIIPRSAAGKLLRGSVGATFRGATARKAFQARVRRAKG